MRPEVVLAGVTVLWGSTFIVTKDVVRELGPFAFLSVRYGVASVVLAVLYARRFPTPKKTLVDGAVLGVINAAGLALQVLGQNYTTASKSAFITSLNTPLTPVMAFLFYRQRPTRARAVAVGIATFGLLLLTWPRGGARWNPGDLLTLGCAVLYANIIVQIARRSPGHDPIALTGVQVAVSALVFVACWLLAHGLLAHLPPASLPELLLLEARPFQPSPRALVELAYMALVCTVLTTILQTWAMARMTATHAAIVFALEPVFATAMAVGIEGSAEWPGARGAGGAALVMLAVLVAEIL